MASLAAEFFLPSVTSMIRLDHTHVLALFRRFRPDTSVRRKEAIVANACLALEVHAQLEEEIFYPALREVAAEEQALEKSVPEHDEMRRLIGVLRSMEAGSASFGATYRELMRNVLHHVAEEETVLLPQAEMLLKDRLGALGLQMTKRRVELLAPHTSELVTTTFYSFPVASVALVAGMVGIALSLLLQGKYSSRHHRLLGRSLRSRTERPRLRVSNRRSNRRAVPK